MLRGTLPRGQISVRNDGQSYLFVRHVQHFDHILVLVGRERGVGHQRDAAIRLTALIVQKIQKENPQQLNIFLLEQESVFIAAYRRAARNDPGRCAHALLAFLKALNETEGEESQ